MMKKPTRSGRLSLRNSILIWVAGIVISWSAAVVVFYQFIRASGPDSSPYVARSKDSAQDSATGLSELAPASGAPEAKEAAPTPPQDGSGPEQDAGI